ncbi:MAG: hypothetical protein ABIJ65_08010 [Chloroflexota bacterium]
METNQKPIWIFSDQMDNFNNFSCAKGIHLWVAIFLQSGHLAYWECRSCSIKDREDETYPEPFDISSCWIEKPLKLISIGAKPPKSERKWLTKKNTTLVEMEPSSVHFLGMQIPGLADAHTYHEIENKGGIHSKYEPIKEQIRLYDDHYMLIRFQVVKGNLVRYKSHCFEDSMYEIPNAKEPDQEIVLSGLKLL